MAKNTIKSYILPVIGLARHCDRSPPDCIAPREAQLPPPSPSERGLIWGRCNSYMLGIRFFYRITLGIPDPYIYVPGARQPKRLPEILNRDELSCSCSP